MIFFKKPIWILTLFLITIPVIVFGIVHWYQNKYEKLPVLGGYDISANHLPVQHIVSDFELENQDGQRFSSHALKNRIVIANFFFTSCAGICPDMMNHIKALQDYCSKNNNIIFISFTVDPERDSAAKLKSYTTKNNINTQNWNLLTGKKTELYKLARKSFYLSANEGDGGENDFIHSEQVVLIDKERHIRGYYRGTDNAAMEQLKHDIKKIENEN